MKNYTSFYQCVSSISSECNTLYEVWGLRYEIDTVNYIGDKLLSNIEYLYNIHLKLPILYIIWYCSNHTRHAHMLDNDLIDLFIKVTWMYNT